jgi:hypothetical protein
MYHDTPITQDECRASERAFLRSIGVRDMNALQRIFEECDYDIDRINRRLGRC